MEWRWKTWFEMRIISCWFPNSSPDHHKRVCRRVRGLFSSSPWPSHVLQVKLRTKKLQWQLGEVQPPIQEESEMNNLINVLDFAQLFNRNWTWIFSIAIATKLTEFSRIVCALFMREIDKENCYFGGLLYHCGGRLLSSVAWWWWPQETAFYQSTAARANYRYAYIILWVLPLLVNRNRHL